MAQEVFYSKRPWHVFASVVGVIALIASWITSFILPVEVGSAFTSWGGQIVWTLIAIAFVCFFLVKLSDKRFHLVTGMFLTVAVNLIIGSLTSAARLPFYLDTIGTVVAGIVGGPLGAALTGTMTSLVWGTVSATQMPYAIVGVFMGAAASFAARRNYLANATRMITSGVVMGVIAGCISLVTSLFAHKGDMSPGTQSLVDFFMLFSNNEFSAIAMQSLLSDPIDKAFTLVVSCAVVYYSPHKLCQAVLRPGYEYLDLRLFNMNLLDKAPDGHFGFKSNPEVPLAPFSPERNKVFEENSQLSDANAT